MRPAARVVMLACVGSLVACQTSGDKKQAAAPSQGATAPPEAHAGSPAGLHNVYKMSDKLYSGSAPEGDAGFESLHQMGVRTIISVDGAAPDVGLAASHGLRYVHIPVTYAEVNDEQRLEIARAIRDLPGPIYVHCHHGKHRGPAALAAASVALGITDPRAAVQYMKDAGTAPNYTGLYQCVAEATVASAAALDTAPHDFPARHKPKGIVAAMVEVEEHFDFVTAIRAAGWKTPADHPDLVPAAEAGQVADNFRFALDDEKCRTWGEDFIALLKDADAKATELEDGIARGDSAEKLEISYKAVAASCTSCHALYRDQRKK